MKPLFKAVKVMNESRSLLKELYELRKLDEPLITGQETMEVLNWQLPHAQRAIQRISEGTDR